MKTVKMSIKLLIITFLVLIIKTSTNSINNIIENDNLDKAVNLSMMTLKVDEIKEAIKYEAKETFSGDLTGYAYNCPLCNGTLGCLPSYNIRDGETTYNDKEYGKVLIVASSPKIPCGSIIRFYSPRVQDNTTLAIVLDRGVLNYNIDLLTPSEDYASKYIGRSKITYDVLRKGWPNEG